MSEKDRYLGREMLFTYLLLCAAIILLREALAFFSFLLIAGLSSGFLFSWSRRKRPSRLMQILMECGALGVFIWLGYSLLNSSLIYRDVILVWIKGALILVTVFSFNSAAAGFLNYIQCFSLPVFMSFPTLLGAYDPLTVVLIFGYIGLWVVVLRLKFYGAFGAYPSAEKGLRLNYANILLAGAFLLSLALSWLAMLNFSLPSLKKGGLFYAGRSTVSAEVELDALEKEYYQLQDKLQTQITNLIPEFQSAKTQYQILALLSSLLKEWPDVMEVEKAKQGLVSLFKTPGPGLAKGEGEGETYLMQKYLEKKMALVLSRTKEEAAQLLKKNPFNLAYRISIARRIKDILKAESYHDLLSQEGQLIEKIKSVSLAEQEKNELYRLSGRLKQWKAYELYYRKSDALSQKADSEASAQFYSLLGSIEGLDSPDTFQQISTNIAQLRAKTPEWLNKEIIAELEELLGLKFEMLFFQEQMQLREKIAQASLPKNKMQELEDRLEKIRYIEQEDKLEEESLALKEEAERYEIELGPEMQDLAASQMHIAERKREAEEQSLVLAQERLKQKELRMLQYKEKTKAVLVKLVFFAYVLIALLLLGLLVTFFILSLAAGQRRKELLLLFDRGPQDFIQALYDNIKEILGILGARSENVLAPLSYAEFVEARYGIKDRLFLLFTRQYEEARYSRHTLSSQDSLLAINYYNHLLRNVFASYSPTTAFVRYLSLLFFKKPLYIAEEIN